MFNLFTKFFKTKQKPTIVNNKQWRLNMWVIVDTRPGILVSIGNPCQVDMVDANTGETTLSLAVGLDALRQAKYHEIPTCRRNISLEAALELGYGT